ncbi:MAG TPA: glycosyltransferase [Nitriliruptorales bacterium]|nr:glycosyltransferase [Nitriliruptorales bacterium]
MIGERVTSIIATRDRRDTLLTTLQRLTSMRDPPRVIVVDNGSQDGTVQAVRRAVPQVQVLALEHNEGAAARNRGVALATTDLVAFSDDDSWWADDALPAAVAHFDRHPELGLIAARILVGPEGRLDPACQEMARSPLAPSPGLPGPRVLGFLACAAVVRRDAMLQAGGFPQPYVIGGEEQPVALELASSGWHLVYVDDVVAHHQPAPQRDVVRRRRLIARNDLWTAWRKRRGLGMARATTAVLRHAMSDRAVAGGAIDAIRGGGWVLRHRSPVPRHVERELRRLDGPR